VNTLLAMTVLVDVFLQSYFGSRGWGVFNEGISFGLFAGNNYLSPFVYLFLIIWLTLIYQKNKRWGILSVIWGGIGNLLPRFFMGGVWDYLYFPILVFWFNLSDVLITVGVVWYLWSETRLPDGQVPRLRSK